MKLRALLTVLLCNVLGIPLFVIGVAGSVGFLHSSWGQWIAGMPDTQPGKLGATTANPYAWVERSIHIDRWVTFPFIALVVGVIAALSYRRSDWRISSLSIVSLVYVSASVLPISIERGLAALFCFLASWIGMKLVSSRLAKTPQAGTDKVR